jgi:ketosteroid isomerase-like protein
MTRIDASALVELLRGGIESSLDAPGQVVRTDEALSLLIEALGAIAHPDLVCTMVGAPGVSATYTGVDGVRAGWADWGETFSVLGIEFDEIVQVSDGALVSVRQVGTTRHGGVHMEHPSAVRIRLRDGLVSAIEFYLDRDQAERAAS